MFPRGPSLRSGRSENAGRAGGLCEQSMLEMKRWPDQINCRLQEADAMVDERNELDLPREFVLTFVSYSTQNAGALAFPASSMSHSFEARRWRGHAVRLHPALAMAQGAVRETSQPLQSFGHMESPTISRYLVSYSRTKSRILPLGFRKYRIIKSAVSYIRKISEFKSISSRIIAI
jgi:hypothetical protein